IITFYKNFNILYNCLYHLKNSLKEIEPPEIILINDNPSLKLQKNEEIKKYFKEILIIDNTENHGYAEACNIAINNASGDVIVLMDCDIMVKGNWLNNMYQSLCSSENIGGVSSIILNMENNTVLHYGFATNKIDMIKPYFGRPIKEIINDIPQDLYRFPTLTSGCCMFRKAVYLQVGGMDKQLYNGYCDLDLFYKMNSAGYKNILCRTAYVYHRGCVSEEVRTYLKTDTKALFCSRWGQSFYKEGLAILKNIFNHAFTKFNDKYLLYNFSRSLFSDDYMSILSEIANILQNYTINVQNNSNVILEDVLSISVQNSKFAIIYFCDDYRQIVKNYFWFSGRKNCGDLIVDRNGNIIKCNDLI
ncbi:MAG: glycosyltransferase, partial [Clostridia bacterium]|nr:glycosyltransferase [Clostridia bacterium]